ncbi:hypothetical protein EDM27_14990, partial [Staphylococcus aureus]
DEALNYQLPIYNSFGMTETCSQFLTATPEMLAQRYDTVGKPSENGYLFYRYIIFQVLVFYYVL